MKEKLLQYPPLKQTQYWDQLHGASLPLLIANLVEHEAGVTLLIAPDNMQALKLRQALQIFIEDSSSIEILFFPDWETLPYDRFSPHQDLISERLFTLSRLGQAKHAIVIAAISTLMHRLCPPAFLTSQVLLLKKGQALNFNQFRTALETAGYRAVNQVLEHGEFAVRGALMDVYPMGSELPFRIELFDDEVDTLRLFDPDTQRTLEKIDEINLLPAHEFPSDEAHITLFRKQYREAFPGLAQQSVIYEGVTAGQFPSGIEYYLPLFFNETATFFDYLPSTTKVICTGESHQEAERFWHEITQRFDQYGHDTSRPLLPPPQLFIPVPEFFKQVGDFTTIYLSSTLFSKKKERFEFSTVPGPSLFVERQSATPLARVFEYVQKKDWCFLFVVESAGRREVLQELLNQAGIFPVVQASWAHFTNNKAPISILVAPLDEGVEFTQSKVAIIVESQLFGEQPVPQRTSAQKALDPEVIIKDLVELKQDDPVVHLDFGIGRYLGLKTLHTQGLTQEFIELLYAGGDKIYVPVTALNIISRYTGTDKAHAPLHKLGSPVWQQEKQKAVEKIHDVAIELLEIYAKRKAEVGTAFQINQTEYARFVSDFPFTETVDQARAIQEMLTDLKRPIPMDRVICGDVGFGKTEVAMRAAFIAVENGKQVCIIVPTTLLAAQHFETFRDRFAGFPVQIALLSRFRSAKETEQVKAGLKAGIVDIVIGTHKLFNRDLLFKNLGLLIIDEEHRFGVKQKEHLKALRHEVHCLTMTATPIPRTLNMAMAGLRDISLIATPPLKRLAIKTFWREKSEPLIREAILREILRGGQVFYLHNKVESIERVTLDLQALVPEAQIRFGHGQMPERSLERLMTDFYHQRFNVLVCTTIIETGIDIPTANTIIIDRADLFGLAQLHQLRGRVGRSHHQAYAYLLTPSQKAMTPDAVKRLEAIVSLEELGSGFVLASHDLEIRGAGELLGEEQSGNMHAIGFSLYMELLERAVEDLKSGKEPELSQPLRQGTDVEVFFSALLPEDYVSDIHTRLILYKRIANAADLDVLESLQVELIDRFGVLPLPTKYLFQVTALKLKAKALGVERIQIAKQEGKLFFDKTPKIDPVVLIQLIQKEAERYRLMGPQCLKVQLENLDPEACIKEITALLTRLSIKQTTP